MRSYKSKMCHLGHISQAREKYTSKDSFSTQQKTRQQVIILNLLIKRHHIESIIVLKTKSFYDWHGTPDYNQISYFHWSTLGTSHLHTPLHWGNTHIQINFLLTGLTHLLLIWGLVTLSSTHQLGLMISQSWYLIKSVSYGH